MRCRQWIFGGAFVSDCFVKIVPREPVYKIPVSLLTEAKKFLESKLSCDCIEIECYDTPQFIDCGSNLERIECPLCGSKLDFDWWGKAMDRAWENHFLSLETELPCCGKTISLNDLNYDFPCAFASCAIIIMNPTVIVEKDVFRHVEDMLGTEITVVKAHL